MTKLEQNLIDEARAYLISLSTTYEFTEKTR